jgi:hypothetical protein
MVIDKDNRTGRDYGRFAAVCAVLSAAAGLFYAVAFIVLGNIQLSAALLLVGGVLTTAALVGVYARLRAVDEAASRLGLTLGVVGAVGSAIHGGYDLAVSLHPVAAGPVDAPKRGRPTGPAHLRRRGTRPARDVMADPTRRTVPAPARLPRPRRRSAARGAVPGPADRARPHQPARAGTRSPHRVRAQPAALRMAGLRSVPRPRSRRRAPQRPADRTPPDGHPSPGRVPALTAGRGARTPAG